MVKFIMLWWVLHLWLIFITFMVGITFMVITFMGDTDAEHRVSYHKLVSNKRERNNCLIKYQTLDFVYVEVLNVNLWKHCDSVLFKVLTGHFFKN